MSMVPDRKRRLDPFDLTFRAFEIAARQGWRTALALAMIGGLGLLARLPAIQGFGAGLLVWAAILYWQYALTAAATAELGAPAAGRQRLLAMIGLCLLSEFGVFIGFGFLLVPGLVLAARWLPSGPILLAEKADIPVALGRSWARTEGDTWPLIGLLFILYGPFLAAAAISIIIEERGANVWLVDEIANFLAYACTVTSWMAGVAVYEVRRDVDEAHLAARA